MQILLSYLVSLIDYDLVSKSADSCEQISFSFSLKFDRHGLFLIQVQSHLCTGYDQEPWCQFIIIYISNIFQYQSIFDQMRSSYMGGLWKYKCQREFENFGRKFGLFRQKLRKFFFFGKFGFLWSKIWTNASFRPKISKTSDWCQLQVRPDLNLKQNRLSNQFSQYIFSNDVHVTCKSPNRSTSRMREKMSLKVNFVPSWDEGLQLISVWRLRDFLVENSHWFRFSITKIQILLNFCPNSPNFRPKFTNSRWQLYFHGLTMRLNWPKSLLTKSWSRKLPIFGWKIVHFDSKLPFYDRIGLFRIIFDHN